MDDNGDGWWVNGYRRIVNLTGNVNTSGSMIQRVASDNSVLSFKYDSVSQSYIAQSNNGQHESLRFDNKFRNGSD